MDRHLKAHLYDISTAIDEIETFFNQFPRRFDEYSRNLMLRRAVERNIVINDLPNLKTEVDVLMANSDR